MAVHWSLIHFGVTQKFWWIELLPKHSHNLADRTFAMYKEQVHPGNGDNSHSGCGAPWDAAGHVKRALSTQSGQSQFAFHLANFDFDTWTRASISKDFGEFKGVRFWRYEYDSNLPKHGYVRVTFKESLLAHPADADGPEWLPHIDGPDGKKITDPEGHLFMQTPFPSLDDDPGIEPWGKFAEKKDAEGVKQVCACTCARSCACACV